jgi:hypothetical protein
MDGVVSGQYIPRHHLIPFDNHVLDGFSKALNSIIGTLDRVSDAIVAAQHSEPCVGHKISGIDGWDSGKISRAPDVVESLDQALHLIWCHGSSSSIKGTARTRMEGEV